MMTFLTDASLAQLDRALDYRLERTVAKKPMNQTSLNYLFGLRIDLEEFLSWMHR
jgi:hypothetical protein